MNIKEEKRKFIIIGITFCLMLAAAIKFNQKLILMLPLVISLFIGAYNAEANRYAVLAGGINSIIYGFTYMYIGLYASSANAFLVGFPIQIITFLQWQKKPYKKTVMFRKMSTKMRIISGIILFASWMTLFLVLYFSKYEYALFDSFLFILGLAIPVLTMLAYVEYSYVALINAVNSLFLNAQLVSNDISQMPYLIFSVYSFYCVVLAFINVRKFYKEQQS